MIADVPPGDYIVEVSPAGYYSGSKLARVDAGVTTTVDFSLTPIPATHTLNIYSSPVTSVFFTLDGESQVTPFSTTLDEGTHSVMMPESTVVGGTSYTSQHWENGSTNPTRTVNLLNDMSITAYYEEVTPPPPPTHTLSIYSSPIDGVSFNLDGESHVTPLSTTLDEGNHTVVVPSTVDVAEKTYNFKNWEGGSTNPARTINLVRDTSITAYYEETPPATHVLSVSSTPITEISFTVDRTEYTTPWSGILIEGTHTVSMPSSVTIGKTTYNFLDWDDRTTNPTRSVDLTRDTAITACYAPSTENSTISGTVADNLGNPIIVARVTIVETGQYVDTLAEPAGYYEFINLTPGTYTIKVEVSGYNPSQTSIVADPAGTYTQDISLTPMPIVTPPLVPSELWQLAIGSLTILGATTYIVLWRRRRRVRKEIKETEYRIALQDVKLEAMLRELDNLQQKGLISSERYGTMRNEIEEELTKIRGLKG